MADSIDRRIPIEFWQEKQSILDSFLQKPHSAALKSKYSTFLFIFPLSLLAISLTFSRVVQVIPVFRMLFSPHICLPTSCDLRVTVCSHQESQERRCSLIGCRQESECPSRAAGIRSVCLRSSSSNTNLYFIQSPILLSF